MSFRFLKFFFTSLVFGTIFFYGRGIVLAQESNSFSLKVSPAYQEVEIPEDVDSVETTITFENGSDTEVQIEIFAFDFKQSDHFGSIALLDGFTGEYLHTLASFLSFEKDSLIVDPYSREDLVVKIKNRGTLSPGGHYAAVVARSVDAQLNSQQKILPAVSSLLLVRKMGGGRIHLSLKEIDWKPKALVTKIPDSVKLTFENEGNVHVIPRGSLKVTDLFGEVVFQGIVNDSSLYLLPGTLREIPVKLSKSRPVFPVMFYSIEIDGRSNIGEATFYFEQSFLYVDRRFSIVLLIILFWLGLRFYKKKKYGKKQ